MKQNRAAWDTDIIAFRIQCGINALGAIHTAMESGSLDPSSYIDGLFCVYDYLDTNCRELHRALGIPESGGEK